MLNVYKIDSFGGDYTAELNVLQALRLQEIGGSAWLLRVLVSLTFSIHLTGFPSRLSWTAMWIMAVPGAGAGDRMSFRTWHALCGLLMHRASFSCLQLWKLLMEQPDNNPENA